MFIQEEPTTPPTLAEMVKSVQVPLIRKPKKKYSQNWKSYNQA